MKLGLLLIGAILTMIIGSGSFMLAFYEEERGKKRLSKLFLIISGISVLVLGIIILPGIVMFIILSLLIWYLIMLFDKSDDGRTAYD